MRMIDADELAKAFREESEADVSKDNRTYWSEALISAAEDVDDAPTVDAVERKRGRWIHDGYDIPHGVDWMHCSVCGRREPHVPAAMTNFCPNCGADMRGEANDIHTN